ncbi:hypothetical protein V7128_05635 [Neobacillus vireti]|uniref:hypothetical protein n=1 Tax=Neobacillus vireti TaxID=220686 RepID=UPI002FFEF425
MKDKIVDYVAGLFEKHNILVLPQIVVLLLSYYLLINSIFLIFLDKFHPKLPQNLLDYNEKILTALGSWNSAVLGLGIALVVAGFINSFLKEYPYLKKYKLYLGFSGIGIEFGIWAIAFSLLSYLFKWTHAWFIIWYIILMIVVGILIRFINKNRGN